MQLIVTHDQTLTQPVLKGQVIEILAGCGWRPFGGRPYGILFLKHGTNEITGIQIGQGTSAFR